jgi:DNA-directed RNA polymerase specialized sigma24 family protein
VFLSGARLGTFVLCFFLDVCWQGTLGGNQQERITRLDLMEKVVPHPELVELLHSPELRRILPELIQYADRRLRRAGFVSTPASASVAAEAEDMVADAVVRAHLGKRPMRANMTLKTYLCGIMWSLVGHKRKAETLRQGDGAETAEDLPAAPSFRNERIDANGFVGELRREIEGDDEVEALFVLLADSEKRLTEAEQAEALGLVEDRFRAAKGRLRRRVKAVRARREGRDDERDPREGPACDPAPPGDGAGRRAHR